MINGMAINPVILGRISIGEIVDIGDAKYPKRTDEFRLTSNVKIGGLWIDHPLAKEFASETGAKLRSIPVRIMFDSVENNFRSGYASFAEDGRQICAASGSQACRTIPGQPKEVMDCASPDRCEFAQRFGCKPYGRLIVAIDSDFEKDPLAGFAFRTSSWNSINAITSRLSQYSALMDKHIAGMPCNLVLRGRSTALSKWQPIFYVDIEPRTSLFQAVTETKAYQAKCQSLGLNLDALDAAVANGYSTSLIVEPSDYAEIILSELTPSQGNDSSEATSNATLSPTENIKPTNATVNSTLSQSEYESPQGGVADMIGEELSEDQFEVSSVLKNVLDSIAKIAELKQIGACRIWVNNKRQELNEREIAMAQKALSDHEKKISAN